MCFIKENIKLKVAKRDIRVIKAVYDNVSYVISPVKQYKYEFNKEYVSQIIIKECDYFQTVDVALHSYSRNCNVSEDGNFIKIEKNGKLSGFYNKGIIFVDCIIPQGAHYDYNGDGEYISDRIKIIGKKKEFTLTK